MFSELKATMTPHETTFSAMLRESGEVLREVEEGDVLLHRRDGADVMLVRADREAGVRESLSATAQLVSLLPDEVLRERVEALTHKMPWLRFLPDEDRLTFVRELVQTAEACAAVGVFDPMGQLIHEWRDTAAVWASPGAVDSLRRPADTDELVPRPG
jgi:hypothetical protein